METRKELKQAVEHRFLTGGLEVRKGETGAPEIFGYALKFGVSYDMGWFTEEIHRDALSGADMEDVRILFNHDVNQILGSLGFGLYSPRATARIRSRILSCGMIPITMAFIFA